MRCPDFSWAITFLTRRASQCPAAALIAADAMGPAWQALTVRQNDVR